MTYAEWMNQHLLTSGNMPSHWSTWQAAERQALERAIRATAQAKTTSHACDAIRALIEGASSDKEGS